MQTGLEQRKGEKMITVFLFLGELFNKSRHSFELLFVSQKAETSNHLYWGDF